MKISKKHGKEIQLKNVSWILTNEDGEKSKIFL
jgi:hypothetical protein